MKKILSILSAAAMVFSLTACGMSEETQTNASESSDSVTAVTEEAALDNSVSETESNDHGMATEEAESMEQSGDTDTTNILVAYFSWADNAVLADDVDAVASPSVIPPGNVQQLAGWVQEETGGHLFSIQVTNPYPSDWDECLARANQERGDNARPELVVWRSHGAAYLFGAERPFRQAGIHVLFPWYRRPCEQRRIDYRGGS